MWLFLSDGFISAVEDRDDNNILIIRARSRKHLADIFQGAQEMIEHTPTADYHYRLRMSKAQVAAIVSNRILNIKYDNFKNSINESRYHDAAMDTWSALRRMQRP